MKRRRSPHNAFCGEMLEARHLLAAGALLVDDSFQVHQNDPEQLLSVLQNDVFDDYAGARELTSVSLGSAGGRIRIGEDLQSLIYAPPADFAGRETLTYYVDGSLSAQIAVDVIAPLQDDKAEVVPDKMQYKFDVLQNDPFWDGYAGERTITLVSTSTTGADVAISDDGQSILYTRLEHVYGNDSLTYIVDERYPAQLRITIQDPLNDDIYEMVQFDPEREFRVLRNDRFWEGYQGQRKITHVLDVPDGATAAISGDGQTIRFAPLGIDAHSYSLRYVVDSQFEARLSIYLQRPVRDDHLTVDKNSERFQVNLLSNDTYWSVISRSQKDVVDRITSIEPSEQGATIAVTQDGQGVFYTPPRDFVGTDSFTYIADGQHRATATVQVREPLDSDYPRNDYYNVFAGTVNNALSVLENDFFGNGYQGPRTITKLSQTEPGGSVRIADGSRHLIYSPVDDVRSDTFTYEVDGIFTATVRVGVQNVTAPDFYVFEQVTAKSLSVLSNDHFGGTYPGPATITGVTQGDRGGIVTISPGGNFVHYVPGNGAETFTYTVDDRFTASVHISYPPRLSSDYFVVDQNSDVTTIDVLENDFRSYTETRWGTYTGPKVITSVEPAENGTVAVTQGGKLLQYKPPADFVGTESLRYTVDGFLSTTVTIDVARRIRHDRVHVDPDSSDNQLDLLANDLVGGDYTGPLVITTVSASQAGAAITVAQDGNSVIYAPPVGFTGQDNFEYTVDGRLKANVTVEVHADVTSLYPKFDSLEAFKQLVLENALLNNPGFGGVLEFGDISADVVKRDHSETNVQVEGVDEADLIETDSDFLYVLTHGQLVINRAWPANQMEVVSRTDIPGQALGQYLHGDRLTVISQAFPVFPFPLEDDFVEQDFLGRSIFPWYPVPSKTFITVLDVSDRATPQLVQRTEVDGNHVQTRRIDDFVYLVVRDPQSLAPPRETICEDDTDSAKCRYETDEEFLKRIEEDFASVLEDILPTYESYGPQGELVRRGLLIQPEDVFLPLTSGASSLVSVVAIDVTNNEPGLTSTTGVLTTGASQLYVTAENLYVFESNYNYIFATESDDLRSQDNPSTKILKFSLNRETGGVDFAATGRVPGQMLNQFSADERDSHLRIATNVSNYRAGNYSGQSENALFVLRDDTGVLEHVGTLQNLALNENIQSVRYFGDQAVVTTFRAIDPLFVLDLSDHDNPHVKGHLTLPGFASYMQFVDQNHLLTIGRSTATGWGGAVAISLFDVSNASQPVLIDQFNWEQFSQSVAGYDHHAFGWFPNRGTLAIPSITSYTQRVDADGDGYRELPEYVTEHQLYTFSIDTSPTTRADSGIDPTGTVQMDSPLLRSAYIDDNLYAIAADSIKAVEINDPDTVLGEVVIRPPEDPVDDPIVDRRLPIIQKLGTQARADLSNQLGIRAEQIMLVTTEADADRTRLAFRVGDEHYVYYGVGDQLELERSDFRFITVTQAPNWHNDANPLDTDGDGFISPRDALVVINALNRDGAGLLPTRNVVRQIDAAASDQAMIDTTGDGYATALDALLIINHLNRSTSVAEAESPQMATDDVFAAAALTDLAAALDDD